MYCPTDRPSLPPPGKTRRRAADCRARAGSSSSVKNDLNDATVMRHEESDSASYVRLYHCDSDPLRHTNSSPTADSTLLVLQPSNLASLDSVLSVLLFQKKQLSSELASRDAAQSAAITAVSHLLNRLERSRSDRSDGESAKLHSVPLLTQLTTVSSNLASRDEIAPTRPPKMLS